MPTPNPEYVRELIGIVNNSPFIKHLPMELVSIALSEATVVMTTSKHHLQPLDTVHGGVLATLIDTATYWASFLNVPQDVGLVNVDLKLNYLRPVGIGRLVAQGRCIKPGRTVSYAEASVTDADGKLVAHGTSTLMALPNQGLRVQACKFLEK